MTLHVNVPLSESTYKRVKRWADLRRQDVGEAIAEYLDDTLPTADKALITPAEADPAVEREKAAYIRLHPHLKSRYLGQYVAIYGGELVDHDEDNGALFERIDERYPDTFVWMTRVEEEPIGTIHFRSPRFAKESQ
jgi:hypothetical protein